MTSNVFGDRAQDFRDEMERRKESTLPRALTPAEAQASGFHPGAGVHQVVIDVPVTASPTVQAAVRYLAEVARLLLEKNAAYGDSAANPLRVFSRVDASAGCRVRIDDKLSRIARGAGEHADEDTRRDLVGYLALLHAIEAGPSGP